MAGQITTHAHEVTNLRRIEGQVRGIIKMVEEERYCIDILMQLSAARSALSGVAKRTLENHIRGCVVHAFKGRKRAEQDRMIEEIIDVLTKFGRGA